MKHYLYNMFSNIKNGQLRRQSFIVHKRKKICENILRVLWEEGFINGYEVASFDTTKLIIFLKYYKNGRPVIQSIKTISKPGRKMYYSVKQLWKLPSIPTVIISTNQGLKTLFTCKKLNLGGEPLISVQ